MTAKELSAVSGFTALALPSPEREISGCYIGDLLSWVMGRAMSGDAWITIMSNQNVIAVASLADISAVILAEGVTLPEDMLELAMEKEINVFTSPIPTYETAKKLFSLLK